jgi:single-strand DNA-binding protein
VRVTSFSIANNRWYKKKGDKDLTEETTYFDVETWSDLAETTSTLQKGKRVSSEGRLKLNSWEKEGVKKEKYILVATIVEILPEKPKEAEAEKTA